MLNAFLIVLVDRQHGRFFRYDLRTRSLERLGEVVVDDVPKNVKGGSWAGLADDKIARHVDAHLQAHLKRVAHETQKHDEPAIIIGGPEEVVVQFQQELPASIQERVEAVIHPQSRGDIKELEERIVQAVSQVYQAHLTGLLKEVAEAGEPGGRGLMGREPVYEALTLKQAQLVMMAAGAQPGYICPNGDGVAANPGQCAACFAELEQAPDVQETLLKIAANQDAEVVMLEKAEILPLQAEGVVALKRYA